MGLNRPAAAAAHVAEGLWLLLLLVRRHGLDAFRKEIGYLFDNWRLACAAAGVAPDAGLAAEVAAAAATPTAGSPSGAG